MTSAAFLAIMVMLGVLVFPEVTHAFTRKTRAFRSENFQRLPYKRDNPSGMDLEDTKFPLPKPQPSWMLSGGSRDLTVEELADRLTENRGLALDFVLKFVDADGDGLISASEVLPPVRRRRR
ncbi:uncharacterized protein LOC143293522 [Babylonia areolata]|uniref:uncharacterized protein LOC143293522 n=1 Tax=Babylonia areolata TaxID=304850 RepID=UPI003FD23428